MKPIYFADAAALAAWLAANPDARECWVGVWKQGTGKENLTWPQIVDACLCVGWIDGLRKTVDERRWMIRLTPRKPRSIWSAINLRRVEALIAEGRVNAAGLAAYGSRDQARARLYSYEQAETATLTRAEERAIRAVPAAWAYYAALPPGRKHTTIHWVTSAKQEATRARRLAVLIECAAKGEPIPPLRPLLKKRPRTAAGRPARARAATPSSAGRRRSR